MIPAQNVVAWGNVVPWTDPRQVAQDLIISRALVRTVWCTVPPRRTPEAHSPPFGSCRCTGFLRGGPAVMHATNVAAGPYSTTG